MVAGMRAILAAFLLLACVAQASQWEKKMEARAKAIRAKYGSGKEPALARRLVEMEAEDQSVRKGPVTGKPEEAAVWERMAETDRRLTAALNEIVARHGWPTYELVGYEGSQAAGLILIHSPDHEFQRRMLPELMGLAEQGLVGGGQVALVTDKLLRSEGKPQRFGTQFTIREGKAVMDPVEDPARLVGRRARYSLMPMGEYKRILRKVYKTKVE